MVEATDDVVGLWVGRAVDPTDVGRGLKSGSGAYSSGRADLCTSGCDRGAVDTGVTSWESVASVSGDKAGSMARGARG